MEFDFNEGPPPASNTPEFTVSELSGKVKTVIETEFSYVRVRGELGRVSQPASGHIYLDLKDERSVISGVIWRGKAAGLSVRPEQGLEVVVTGKLTTFAGQSKYQIVIEKLEPAGQGALMALLEERKKKLAQEGLMAESAKQKLPFMPRVVGIVTSPTGAVIRDMMHGFRERFPVHVLVWPVRVQGETAAREIAAGIAGFNAIEAGGTVPRPDVLIVARGGGSLEDLWSFNEEVVARAAAASKIPLISAVGHETDWTLIDYVADARAPTPTKAAEWAVPKQSELVTRLADLKARHLKVMARLIESKQVGLKSAGRGLPRLIDLVGIPRQRLDGAGQRLAQGLKSFAASKRHGLQKFEGRLQPFLLQHRLARGRERLTLYSRAMSQSLMRRAQFSRQRFLAQVQRFKPLMVMRRIRLGKERLADVGGRQNRAFATRVQVQRGQLERFGQLLATLSYQSVLARGFALVRNGDGQMVRAVGRLQVGDQLEVEFVDGRVGVDVSSLEGTAVKTGKKPKNKPTKNKVKKSSADEGGQGSLF